MHGDSFLFEAEGGTYSYNSSNKFITYTCLYDSVLDFHNQTFTVYSKKHYYANETATYTEKVQFTYELEGKRGWLTQDAFLYSLIEKDEHVTYIMNRFTTNK